jgi:hypothetical protein
MSKNIGTVDRAIRLIVGIGLLGLYGALEPPMRYLTLLGLIPLGTALLGNCPMYTLFGVSTRSKSGTAPPP